MTIRHHPDDATLLDYATGTLAESFALIVATHLALCPACRRTVSAMEAIGGALVEAEPAAEAPAGGFEALMARIEAMPPDPGPPPPPSFHPEAASLPRPLRDLMPAGLGSLPWRRAGAIEQALLPCPDAGHRIRRLRILPGRGAPRHTHRGVEMTLVLQGAYSDATGRFARGDLEWADSDLDHRPVAEGGEVCICLAVTSAPLRLTGRLGRLIDPFLDI